MANILFVVTNHTELGNTGRKTGFHFTEMYDPFEFLKQQGHAITFMSPTGGSAIPDGVDQNDPRWAEFQTDTKLQEQLRNTLAPADIKLEEYDAIYFVGGYGTMWDFANNATMDALTAQMYEDEKVVAAVCHGPAGIVNVTLRDGSYLVSGKNVAAFSDDEERAVKLENVVPFMLETTLREHGANYTKAPLWEANVEIDGRLVTGQNPASALGVGKAVHELLETK